ncbi:transposase [Mycobacterium tuberculosis RGTB327]|nr:transposase [Mycobacterium tuberculosis RGTB327]
MRRITGELAGIAEQALTEAAAVVRNAQRAVRRASGRRKAWLRQAINHLEKLIGRTERVVDQARSRLAGVMPDSSSRLVSLHDADARPIRKGRLGKPVEFGYKAQVVDNADGVILDHSVELGNPADAPQLAPAIERISRRTGRPPRAVTADRGCGDASVEDDLHQLGVRNVAIPRKSKPSATRRAFEHRRAIPRQDQMANRIRRTHQPPQAQLRLEPHRTHRHHRRPNLVRTRRLRPQPRQDQHPGSVTDTRAHPDHATQVAQPAAVNATATFSGLSN